MFERGLIDNMCRLTGKPIGVPMYEAFCSAPREAIAELIRELQYEIVRRGFDHSPRPV
jgi:hypothetical protein